VDSQARGVREENKLIKEGGPSGEVLIHSTVLSSAQSSMHALRP